MSQPAMVLVVEDDPALREAVALALSDEGFGVHPEPDAEGGPEVARTARADVAVVDIRLPGPTSGLELGRRLVEEIGIPVVFLTAADGLEDRLAGFRAGADDYVIKPFSMTELVARLRAVLRRTGRGGTTRWQVGDLVIDEGGRTVERDGRQIDLTRTEFELLTALARRPGRVLSKLQLLSEVWGYSGYDTNVVEVHISALRRKLQDDTPPMLHTVRGVGYVLRPPSS